VFSRVLDEQIRLVPDHFLQDLTSEEVVYKESELQVILDADLNDADLRFLHLIKKTFGNTQITKSSYSKKG
jgi:hypothetical protein